MWIYKINKDALIFNQYLVKFQSGIGQSNPAMKR